LKGRKFDMTKNVTKFEVLENKFRNLPSASPEAMENILKGLYAGIVTASPPFFRHV
jgi:hypothetical protein